MFRYRRVQLPKIWAKWCTAEDTQASYGSSDSRASASSLWNRTSQPSRWHPRSEGTSRHTPGTATRSIHARVSNCNRVPSSTYVAEQQRGEPKTDPQPVPAATAFNAEVSQTAYPIATVRIIDHILGDEPAWEPTDHPARLGVSPPPAPSATQAGTFAVQVGAFLLEREAESLVQDLREKGYSPQIAQFWAMRHSRKRLWYAVRSGGYADRRQAAHAATDFTSKEGKLAIVRPMDAL
jgi:cell division septation protein DedD